MMGKFRRFRGLEGLAVLLILTVVACSRPSDFPADDAGLNSADQNKLPFHDNAAKGPESGKANSGEANPAEVSTEQAANGNTKAPSDAPFRHLGSVAELPAGTLVTVRLENQISRVRVGDEATFAAAVDEPVLMDGRVAVPPGAMVTGTIESDRGARGRGYIRLTLDTITVAGKKVPLRTASLFVRGTAGEVLSTGSGQEESEPADFVTGLQKGHRLTFRLAATLPLNRQQTVSRDQAHLPDAQ